MSAGRRPHARAQPTQWLFHNQNFTDILIYSTINISNTPETNSYYYTTLYQEDGHVFECMLMYIIRFLWYACRLNNLIDTGIWSVIVIFDLTVRAFFSYFLKRQLSPLEYTSCAMGDFKNMHEMCNKTLRPTICKSDKVLSHVRFEPATVATAWTTRLSGYYLSIYLCK